ncbi:3-phosphoshikimate 1-carboxyvinyltransferase [Aureibacillus halotolerans]|uniref:3-phosphoshikimate 1-carboxyvinyltransferase n=1 Tax=Aureibacillus halotolerans TaxID=1508390 RepID=A0A4R6TZE4_9BACI|nr:3-phosphoshikimate 1-carboxyvinyltransferase [Aureibacillus halotolerans]TDQ37439.1 3-phosphoshikimate 1-carboxyvinyltransferase [Aureibacillus halotolerans]
MAHVPDLEARSPWSEISQYKAVTIHQHKEPMNGSITIPGSKSFTNRALILAAFAEGTSRLDGVLRSDDSYFCLEALKSIGVAIEIDGESVVVHGIGGQRLNQSAELYIGAAGTTARFLPGLLSAHTDVPQTVRASRRMSERPVKPLFDVLEQWGQAVTYEQTPGVYPVKLEAAEFLGGEGTISGKQSSQFISGLLMAAPAAKNGVVLNVTDGIVQHAYVKITIDIMKEHGVNVTYNDDFNRFEVAPQVYQPKDYSLEADASTACYFFALAALHGGTVEVTNMNLDTNQPDIGVLEILETFGCTVETSGSTVKVTGPEQLKGGRTISMKEMSDQALTIAALVPFCDGPITITDVEHIRHHESDRIQAMTESLTQLGIDITEHQDGWTIHPGQPKAGESLSSYDDHRIAMSLALIGTKIEQLTIEDPGSVSKTCPTFFDMLEQFNVRVSRKA